MDRDLRNERPPSPVGRRAVQIILAPLPGCVVTDTMNPGCRFAQPGANLLPALRAGFARRRRARRLARGERAKRATPGTCSRYPNFQSPVGSGTHPNGPLGWRIDLYVVAVVHCPRETKCLNGTRNERGE